MRKHILWGACLLSLIATSCGNEDTTDNNNTSASGKTISINATINNGTRMTYDDDQTNKVFKFNWSAQESFNIYQGNSSTPSLFSKTEEGNTFKGTSPASGEGTYYAVYGNGITNNNGVLAVNIANQTASAAAENGITAFMVAETASLSSPLSFNHKLTILKLNLTIPFSATGKINKVTLSGLHNKADYNLSTGQYAYSNGGKGDIITTNANAGFTIESNKITAYVAVFPENVTANSLTINATDGVDNYTYTMTSGKSLTAGKMVPVNITMKQLTINGYEVVDLGLSVKWATRNVGAQKPQDFGSYYAWGDIKTRTSYGWNTYLDGIYTDIDYGDEGDPLKDYIGVNPAKNFSGDPNFDAARKEWGGTWQMPTKEQVEELINESNCSRAWTDNYNSTGIKGFIITSKKTGFTGNSIFLPAAGCRYDEKLDDENGILWYQTSSPNPTVYENNIIFHSFSSSRISIGMEDRTYGLSIRPVSK